MRSAASATEVLHLFDMLQPGWEAFRDVTEECGDGYDFDPGVRLHANNRYLVIETPVGVGPMGKVTWLSIHDKDRTSRHDWRDLQRIKNEICGPECEGVEIYPAESQLVDMANQWHMYVFEAPTMTEFGIGFCERMVGEMKPEGRGNQRPWREGEKPADIATSEEIRAAVAEYKKKGSRVA